MIYLDNAASTPLSAAARDAMMPHLEGRYGNPSSIHRQGREALRAVSAARRQAAGLIGASPSEIVFTSGGTESNNMAVLGIARARPGSHIITTAIEHDAVLEACALAESEGHDITYVRPDSGGIVDPADVASALRPETALVSVMAANNEVGTVQDIAAIARLCAKSGAAVHTDAVQAAGKIPIDAGGLGADLVSFSSHKIGGPKGAGALYVRSGTRLVPLVCGGGQEGGRRSGTENVAAIAGFGAACAQAASRLDSDAGRVRALRARLIEGVASRISHSQLNGDPERRVPGNAHFTFLGISGEDLIIKLDEHGVAASTGSACSVNRQKESHVLRAMGLGREQIGGSLRLTVGPQNTESEIDGALEALESCVAELRRVSPFRQKYGF